MYNKFTYNYIYYLFIILFLIDLFIYSFKKIIYTR